MNNDEVLKWLLSRGDIMTFINMHLEEEFAIKLRQWGICPECMEYQPDDERVKNGMKCRRCSYG